VHTRISKSTVCKRRLVCSASDTNRIPRLKYCTANAFTYGIGPAVCPICDHLRLSMTIYDTVVRTLMFSRLRFPSVEKDLDILLLRTCNLERHNRAAGSHTYWMEVLPVCSTRRSKTDWLSWLTLQRARLFYSIIYYWLIALRPAYRYVQVQQGINFNFIQEGHWLRAESTSIQQQHNITTYYLTWY
jgi:hypothetical protein